LAVSTEGGVLITTNTNTNYDSDASKKNLPRDSDQTIMSRMIKIWGILQKQR